MWSCAGGGGAIGRGDKYGWRDAEEGNERQVLVLLFSVAVVFVVRPRRR